MAPTMLLVTTSPTTSNNASALIATWMRLAPSSAAGLVM